MNLRALLIFVVLHLLFLSSAIALTIQQKKDIYNITTEIEQNDNFNQPDSIIITPISIPLDTDINDYDWYKGLLYYQGLRIYQGDFLFHYFITSKGEILEGNSKGIDQRFKIENLNSSPIIIGYFAKKNENDFPAPVKETLKAFLLKLANENSINPSQIYVKGISNKIEKDQPVQIDLNFIGGMWEVSIKNIIKELIPNYLPVLKPFQLKLETIELPTATVNYGDETVMKLTIKNVSPYILYQASNANILISKKDNTPSLFFYNNIWSSNSQAEIIPEGTFIKPDESKTFTVKLGTPLYFGVQTEKFHLTNVLGQVYSNTDFDITLNINKPSTQVIEIAQTETGQLNVREGPWSSSPVIQRVTPGQRFFVLERRDSGWVRIDLGNNKSGWISAKYAKVI